MRKYKVKLFLTEGCQLGNGEWMVKLENQHFVTPSIITNSSFRLISARYNDGVKGCRGTRYSYRFLLNYSGEKLLLQWRGLADIPWSNDHTKPWRLQDKLMPCSSRGRGSTQHHPCNILTKKIYPNSNHKETVQQPRVWVIL